MKITCPHCNQDLIDDFNNTLTFCTNCGGKLTVSEKSGSNQRNQFSLILLTSLITSIFVLSIVGIGAYFYFSKNSVLTSSDESSPTFTPNKKKISVSAAEINKVEMRIDSYRKDTSKNLMGYLQMQANISLSNTNFESKVVRFYADGKAEKITVTKKYDSNSTSQSEDKSEFIGLVSASQFSELAEIIVKNDFMNHPRQQKNSPTLGTSVIQVSSAKGDNTVSLYFSGNNSSQIEPIVQAIKSLESKIDWKFSK